MLFNKKENHEISTVKLLSLLNAYMYNKKYSVIKISKKFSTSLLNIILLLKMFQNKKEKVSKNFDAL